MKHNTDVVRGWKTSQLNSVNQVFDTLDFLEKNMWVVRGHSQCWGKLVPKIDRRPFNKIRDREKKLKLEMESIRLFQSIANSVASIAELEQLKHDMNSLMVLQHYGVPTRLLDWSLSPHVATFFAVNNDENDDGELWGFSYDKYTEMGDEHWKVYTDIPLNSPIEVRYDMAFNVNVPKPDYFICVFDYLFHHRINAQKGLFTMTACFDKDHAKSISNLFNYNVNFYNRYIIKSDLKLEIQKILKETHEIGLGSLFPDTAGAAEAVKANLNRSAKLIKI